MIAKTTLFLVLISLVFSTGLSSQNTNFEYYRYTNIDTTKLNRTLTRTQNKEQLTAKLSKLFLRKQEVQFLYFLNKIAEKHQTENKVVQSRELLLENISLANSINHKSFEYAYSFYILSKSYISERNYELISHYANKFCEALSDHPDSLLQCLAFSNAAKWNFIARNIEKGFEQFDLSNNIARKQGYTAILQNNYSNAGNILTFYEPEQATKFLDYAIYLSKSNKYVTSEDRVYLYLISGASYLARDKFDKALENFQYSLAVLKQDSVSNLRFERTLNYYIAVSYKWKKEYDEAIKWAEFFNNGVTYSEEGLKVLGEIYFIQQKYDSAIIYLHKLYDILPKKLYGKSNTQALLVLNNIAICNQHIGNKELAKNQFRECLFTMAEDSNLSGEMHLPRVTPTDNSSYHYWHTFISSYTQLLQDEYLTNGKYSLVDVLNCFFNDLNSLNNKIFVKSNMSSKYMFSSIAKETSMQLLNFVATQKEIPDSLMAKVWNTVAFSKNNYLNAELSKENSQLQLKTEEQIRYDSLNVQFNNYNLLAENQEHITEDELICFKEIFVLSHNKKAELLYPSIQLDVNIDSSIRCLKPTETIIDYYSNDSCIYFFTYADSEIQFHKVTDTELVFHTMKSFYRSIKSGSKTEGNMDQILIQELGIDKLLKPNYTLYFIPDNNMAIFPIETLKNSNGQYLIENNSILYLYSTSQLVDSMDYTEYMNEVTCFAPGFLSNTQDQMHDTLHRGVSLNPLPYSIQECQQIDSVFTKNSSTSLRLHYDANTNNFFNDITNSKIIHIATHGIASKNSLNNTGIFLYNDHKGIDFISFDKIKNNSIKAELTVLSACKTAEGMEVDGEGKMSLSYGFMFAGSKNVIASLWDVSDKVTRELMLDFYSNIKNEKMSYSEAMQKAKIDFIKKGYSPIDWGSFILLGR